MVAAEQEGGRPPGPHYHILPGNSYQCCMLIGQESLARGDRANAPHPPKKAQSGRVPRGEVKQRPPQSTRRGEPLPGLPPLHSTTHQSQRRSHPSAAPPGPARQSQCVSQRRAPPSCCGRRPYTPGLSQPFILQSISYFHTDITLKCLSGKHSKGMFKNKEKQMSRSVRVQQPLISKDVQERRWEYLGHVLRMKQKCLP
ncbi:uncharacterized protein LOC120375748 isoform X2 [Mauremys reevesii]|uniref:uncharacterized protein LOC120375748 isoform X2 n=1 Tax=Mauremys reevesii TaxID=260615 RepID=UPI0019401BE9|nr:uncharacterized protein LOC120375748 isoform X2 [Mauremys reevesii]